MIAAILKKLGLGKALIALLDWLLPHRRETMSAEEGMRVLSELRPCPAGSCIAKCTGHPAEMTAKRPDIDIIIPAYNAEKYLRDCLDSVLSQRTKYSFRAIVIDDGSTDSTPQILKEYSGDGRLLIRRQENRGFSGARNAGLELSDGEYIYFLDSDDMLGEDALERLMSCARENDADMVEGGFVYIDTQGKTVRRCPHGEGRLDPVRDCSGFPCGKLYRAQIFDRLRFPPDFWYEDSIVSHIVCPALERDGGSAFGCGCTAFYYRVNPQGISQSGRNSPKCIDALWIHMRLYEDRRALGMENTQSYYEYMLRMLALTYRRTARQSDEARRAVFAVFADFLSREFNGFKTRSPLYGRLEKAMEARDFRRYSLFSRLA